MEPDFNLLTSEVKSLGVEAKAALDKLAQADYETSARLLAIEQKITARTGGFGGGYGEKSLGEQVCESEQFRAMMSGGTKSTGQIRIGSFFGTKTAIVNATGQNQPLVPDMRVPGIIAPAQRRLTVRDLLSVGRTSSNLVQFAKETAFTNAAASQSGENVSKAESAATFELDNAPVQTIAHWIPASRQILDDAPALQDYLNSRLRYFLAYEEERQLLNGSGSGNDLLGLVAQATTFDTTAFPPTTTSDTMLDTIGYAINQCQLSNLVPDGIVLHPSDFWKISLIKETGSGISSGQYVFASPQAMTQPRLWGLPVVATQSMTRSQFLVGRFQNGRPDLGPVRRHGRNLART